MKYDFTTIIDRAGKDATAFDGIGKTVWGFEPDKAKPGFDEIPMWVADMNFATCPAVVQAMEQRLKHPLFGYFLPSDAYYQRIIDWQTTRHDWPELTRDMIGYENGVHGGITSTIQVLTEPGDAVLVHSPTYPGFIGDLSNTGRHVVFSPLRKGRAFGAWISLIWKKKSRSIMSTWPFSAHLRIRQAACGNAGKLNRPWPFSKNTMS